MKQILYLIIPFFISCTQNTSIKEENIQDNNTILQIANTPPKNNTTADNLTVTVSKFEAWRQNSATKKMEFVKTINQSVSINIIKVTNDVIITNNNGEKQLLSFYKLERKDMGHVIGFGDKNSELMFNFIPAEQLLFIKINDVIIFKFKLSKEDSNQLNSFF